MAAWREIARTPTTTVRQPCPASLEPRCSTASAPRSPRGQPLIGGGAGTGLSAKCEEAGGIDLIVIYNSGRYRMAGRGSLAGLLAYGNANEIVCEMAHEVLPVVQHTPVLAGRQRHRPVHDPATQFLQRLIDLGFSRRPELPHRRPDRRHLPRQPRRDRHGLRPRGRADRARAALDLLTTPYVFSEADARDMAAAGADIVVCHLGLTTGGSIGAGTALKLADCVAPINAWAAAATRGESRASSCCATAARSPRPTTPQYILRHCPGCNGFYGASSMERLPTEMALTETTRRFTQITREETRP